MFNRYHKAIYDALDVFILKNVLQKVYLPLIVSPNFITYSRTALLLPLTLHFINVAATGSSSADASLDLASSLSPQYDLSTNLSFKDQLLRIAPLSTAPVTANHVIPAILVATNLFLDFADGALARFEKRHPERRIERIKWYESIKSNPLSIFSSNNQMYNQIADGNHVDDVEALKQKEITFYENEMKKHDVWGGYIDAMADKAFAIPVWIGIVSLYPSNFVILQGVLYSHVAIETLSCFVRTRDYVNEIKNLESAEDETNNNKPKSKVHAESVGKIKQIFSMTGTALLMLPPTSTVGFYCMAGSLPLAFISVYRKIPRFLSS